MKPVKRNRTKRSSGSTWHRFQLCFEVLEDRLTPTGFGFFFVDTTANADDGDVSAGNVSLREAIRLANETPGTDVIAFNIPTSDPGFAGGVWTIRPQSALPAITEAAIIDGTSQPGFAGSPLIQINGVDAGANSSGLVLFNHLGSSISGLVINRFKQHGIVLEAGGSHLVAGNFIGTNRTGTKALANRGNGILIQGSDDNIIGGATAGDRNVISGNRNDGIHLEGGSSANRIVGNYIGTDVSGTQKLGNRDDGIYLQEGFDNVIGSTISGEANVISANGYNGIFLYGTKLIGTVIEGNRIGTDKDGNDAGLGNGQRASFADGIFIAESVTTEEVFGPSNSVIRFNTIAYNIDSGIAMGLSPTDSSSGNQISENSIHDNGGLAIDLGSDGVTANDPGDPDVGGSNLDGPNRLQNFPVLDEPEPTSSTDFDVTGTLDSIAGTNFRIEFYASDEAGEAAIFLGFVNVAAGLGPTPFLFSYTRVIGSPFITAIAINTTTEDTSELSASVRQPGPIIAIGAGSKAAPRVRVFDAESNTFLYQFLAYPASYQGGVRVAAGDVTGDGVPDVITAPRNGASKIKVFDGTTGQPWSLLPDGFLAFPAGQKFGAEVAVGSFNASAGAEIVVGMGRGGPPRVRIFDVAGGSVQQLAGPLGDFLAYSAGFTGGVRVSTVNYDSSGFSEVVVAPGDGGGGAGRVKVFADVAGQLQTLLDCQPFGANYHGAIFAVIGDIDGAAGLEIVSSRGQSGAPQVRIFDASGATQLDSFLAYSASFKGGVKLDLVDTNADGSLDILTGQGQGGKGLVRLFDGASRDQLSEFFAFGAGYDRPISVAGG